MYSLKTYIHDLCFYDEATKTFQYPINRAAVSTFMFNFLTFLVVTHLDMYFFKVSCRH